MQGSKRARILAAVAVAAVLAGCSGTPEAPPTIEAQPNQAANYQIGPGDKLQVFVWRNAELSTTVVVRPDGKISVPLIEDLQVAGKTPTQVARAMEEKLATYVKDAIVTVMIVDFVGPVDRQIRVVGEAAQPLALPYRQGMTVMDAMISAGGLTQFAAGNRAKILRTDGGKSTTYRVRLDDLMKDGDLSANAELAPGDVLMIPQSWF